MSENIAVSNESEVLEEEMPDGQDWADLSDDTGTNSELPASGETPLMFTPEESTPEESSADDQPLPPELRELISVSGIQLIRCDNAWNVEGWAAKLRKYLSVTFSIDEDITGAEILDGFEEAGFDVTKVVSIQRKISNRSWVVSFSEQAEKDRVIAKGRCTIKGTVVFLGDADTCTEIVKIFEAPDEMPDTVVIGRLSCFGRVLSFRRDVAPATGVRNGVRTARMRISRDIPCSVHVAGEALSIKYASQPRSCRRCGGSGHFANDCKLPRCYNCDLSGHRAMECQESVLCGVCFRSTHPLSECPFVLFSANVASSYAEAAKGDNTAKKSRPERTPEQQEAMRAAAAEAAKKRESDKEKQKQREKKEREEKERKEKERKEKERKEREEKERKERDERERKEREEKDRREKEERDRRRREKDDEDERRKRDDRRKDYRDRDWSRSRERSPRERDRDYDRYRDYDRDRYYRDKDRDRRHRDHSPHYSDSEHESSRRSHRY